MWIHSALSTEIANAFFVLFGQNQVRCWCMKGHQEKGFTSSTKDRWSSTSYSLSLFLMLSSCLLHFPFLSIFQKTCSNNRMLQSERARGAWGGALCYGVQNGGSHHFHVDLPCAFQFTCVCKLLVCIQAEVSASISGTMMQHTMPILKPGDYFGYGMLTSWNQWFYPSHWACLLQLDSVIGLSPSLIEAQPFVIFKKDLGCRDLFLWNFIDMHKFQTFGWPNFCGMLLGGNSLFWTCENTPQSWHKCNHWGPPFLSCEAQKH